MLGSVWIVVLFQDNSVKLGASVVVVIFKAFSKARILMFCSKGHRQNKKNMEFSILGLGTISFKFNPVPPKYGKFHTFFFTILTASLRLSYSVLASLASLQSFSCCAISTLWVLFSKIWLACSGGIHLHIFFLGYNFYGSFYILTQNFQIPLLTLWLNFVTQ